MFDEERAHILGLISSQYGFPYIEYDEPSFCNPIESVECLALELSKGDVSNGVHTIGCEKVRVPVPKITEHFYYYICTDHQSVRAVWCIGDTKL